MLVRFPATLPGTKPANSPTNTSRIRLALYGVLNFDEDRRASLGSHPACDIEKKTRDALATLPGITEENPARMRSSQGYPAISYPA